MLKIGVVEMKVRNFGKTLQFYTEVLGVVPVVVEGQDKFAILDTGEAKLALWESKEAGATKGNVTLYFPTKNIQETILQLQKKNVYVRQIEERHWGKRALFKDVEGNEHYVYEHM